MRVLNILVFCICFFSLEAKSFEPVVTQLVWKSDLEVGSQSFFLVEAEPVRFAEGPLGVSYNLNFYGEKDGKKFLAFQDKNLGAEIYGIFHPGQMDSPLIVVSSTNGRFKTISGYHYENGKISKDFQVDSVFFPEILIRKSGGVYVMISEKDENNQLKSRSLFYFQKFWFGTDTSLNRDLTRPFGQRFDGLDRTTNN